jgi:hypothetical protein
MNNVRFWKVAIVLLAFAVLFSAQTALANNFIQQSGTTGGELRRHIDISSPWSAGYIYEDLTVIGKAMVTDSFTMNNMSPGADVDYWDSPFDDFGFDANPAPAQQEKSAAGSSTTTVTGSGEKPAAAVAGVNVEVEAESENDVRKGFRWLDLF